MWLSDDKIMNIFNYLDYSNNFPCVCPVCGKKEGHIFMFRPSLEKRRGGGWVWCSSCKNSAHVDMAVPDWWVNNPEIDASKLTFDPDYLEDNKKIIDQWITGLK